MSPYRVRSFQGRIFLAVLAVVLIPTAVGVAGGMFTLQSIGSRSGTLGAWDAVAETGLQLLDMVEDPGAADSALATVASRHREALSESVRLSRLYTFVAERFLNVLPVAALLFGLLITGLAFLVARGLSRSFATPIEELAGWTERIARGEPLPAKGTGPMVEELKTLRTGLRRMSEQLEEGRRKAVENAQMRSWTEMARRVSHEIKNPLTPMRMAAATLTKGSEGSQAEAGQVLLEEIARLDEMARTFSQYGRIPEGPRSRIDVPELLSLVAGQHASPSVPVEVSAPTGLCVDGHYDALERAFRNLVLNAVEAQQEDGGRVDIHVGEEGADAVIRIEDRGPGIAAELIDSVWNPDVTTKSRGTGLGLAIVRQTMRHHDGNVTVRNRPQGGAIFEIRLPLAAATER
jgi:signal transduction histidine kinase